MVVICAVNGISATILCHTQSSSWLKALLHRVLNREMMLCQQHGFFRRLPGWESLALAATQDRI